MLVRVWAEVGACRASGRAEAKPICWGCPSFGVHHRLGDRVSWGGRCLLTEPRAYACASCGEEYGNAGMRSDEAIDLGSSSS